MTIPENGGMRAILEKIGEITAQAADDSYIFRGEPECYEKVTSTLYRQYEKAIEAGEIDIEVMQNVILSEAKQYTDETSDELLSKLQHYGSKTNLIDFTTDLHTALFFACGHPDEDGRVILQRTSNAMLKRARRPRNRVTSQKSIFVQPRKGFLDPESGKVILIPKELKLPMLDYLRKYHCITAETLFSDLQGFIRLQGLYYEAYTAFFKGNTSADQKDYDEAIQHFTEAIRLRPDISSPYENRGSVYQLKGDLEQAIRDYDKAIELAPTGTTHFKRGLAFMEQQKWSEAESDICEAWKAGVHVNILFSIRYPTITRFEEEHGVKVPENFKAILRLT